MLALRPYTPLRMVLTVCGECFREDPNRQIEYERDILQGNLVLMDGKVYLRRHCRRGHGEVVSLYEEDYALWEALQQWRVPTKEIVPDTAGNARPIPMGYRDGLGDLQTQHSCILLIDVTENCNLTCPTCFAGSSPGLARYAPTAAILRTLDAAIAREGGHIDVLMLSGGEPTVHPDILDILREAAARPVTRIILNTNGIRVAKDDRLLDTLARLRGRVEVYLQFDGFALATHLYHRGEDLRAVKAAALERLTGQRVFTTLAMAVARGVNDDEVGAVADYALATDYIGGVAYQPVFGSGRANPIDPLDRVTTTGVLRRLAAQTGGRVAAADFIALPCSHPDCCAIGYYVRDDVGRMRSVAGLVGLDRLKAHLGLVANQIAPDETALKQALLGLMSETTTITRPEMVDYLLTLCESCHLGLGAFVRQFGRMVAGRQGPGDDPVSKWVKRFTVKSFMDAWTLNVERLQQCCVHVGSTDPASNPVRVPFCARQLFGDLRERTSAGMVPAQQLVRPGRRVARR